MVQLCPFGSILQTKQSHKLKSAFCKHFSKLQIDGHATIDEVNYLIKLSKNCYQFMYGKAHGLVFLLHPRFIGEGLNTTNCGELENIQIDTPVDDKAPVEKMKGEKSFIFRTQNSQFQL